MDRTSGRLKRKKQQTDTWECSVCTFQNPKETFKCMICDTRKGTSTRKPKQDSALAYQQQIEQSILREREEHESAVVKKKRDILPNEKLTMSPPASESSVNTSSEGKPKRKHKWPPKLKNVDRSTARPVTVTYNGVSVVITDYQPLLRGPRSGSETSPTGTVKGGKSVSINSSRNDSDGGGDNTDGAAATANSESDVKRCSPESGKSTGTSSTVAMSDRESDGDDHDLKK